jgi:hypothetical protein
MGFQYVALRCVPRADREEFLNVGVVIYCQAADFLAARCQVDRPRLLALDPAVDLDAVASALSAVEAVCRGDESAGHAGRGDMGTRFGFVKAPRSTVVQPGPVHGGVTSDPSAQLEHLLRSLVSRPGPSTVVGDDDPAGEGPSAPAQTGTSSTAPTA